ncbi:MAG: proliferating cell nuclear antigen (pcna) [Candidatus Puniceispirillum sp. TMED52]|jgi:proliferating cell nuclear antigen|nr:MAG: proliferating cell nuclear antigen (pcna) [Candidatus Puniceispirillum sp. TMED52]RPF82043.1 MAG: proliferating cell nuclear antigen (pcna) [Rhodothermaceae bacterium TMED105]|tara:strand:- start:653 stop:1444 length:792 start_codon:yes stop_codon:yes gene_type:complete
MFEARMSDGLLLKKIIDSMSWITETNFDCTDGGVAVQAMDANHVALASLVLHRGGFQHYRCDRPLTLGVNIASIGKILKCCNPEDVLTLKADDDGNSLMMMFEALKGDKISDFELKLMQIDSEQLGIPDTEFSCYAKLSSQEFGRICKDLMVMGDTVVISIGKEGLKFSVQGDMGTGNIHLRDNSQNMDVKEGEMVEIRSSEACALSFSLKYLNFFAKATPLSSYVSLSMNKGIPLVTEYSLGDDMGWVRFYLAPKMDDEMAT